jgi:hypothetical protein
MTTTRAYLYTLQADFATSWENTQHTYCQISVGYAILSMSTVGTNGQAETPVRRSARQAGTRTDSPGKCNELYCMKVNRGVAQSASAQRSGR